MPVPAATNATAPPAPTTITASTFVRKVHRECSSCGAVVRVPAHSDEAWHGTARCGACVGAND